MAEASAHNALPAGSMVQEYRILQVLGAGSFGIVYKAENIYLDEVVAIKEFLPTDLAFRSEGTRVTPLSSDTEEPYVWALKQFLKEAQILWSLARPERHPNIVRVSRFHEDNGTAYMVMDFEGGRPLSALLGERDSRGEAELRSRPLTEQELRERTVPEPELRAILEPLLDGLERVHQASVWHRDIKPANILVRPDGSPVLIDFGAARQERADRARSVMAMFSPAYAAPEQVLAMGEQGPWTDIYSLGATLYRAIAGKPPTGVSERALGAPHAPATEAGAGRYGHAFLAAIDAALVLQPRDRPQSIAAWRPLFHGAAPAPVADALDRTVILPSTGAAGGTRTRVEPAPESLALDAILPPPAAPAGAAAAARPAAPGGGRRLWPWALAAVAAAAVAVVVVVMPPKPSPEVAPVTSPPAAATAPVPATEPLATPSTEELIARLDSRPPAAARPGEGVARPPEPPSAERPRLVPAPSTPAPPHAVAPSTLPRVTEPEPLPAPKPAAVAPSEPTPAPKPAAVAVPEPAPPPKPAVVPPAEPAPTPRPAVAPPTPAVTPGAAPAAESPPARPATETQVARVERPMPAAPPAPAFDPVSVTAEIERVLAGFECARLSSTVAPDRRVFVSGSVARAADVARVRAAIQGVPQVAQVVADLSVLEWPFCELLGVVDALAPPPEAPARGPRLELNHASGAYREGEFLVVGATAGQAYDGYLYVIYVDSAGDLVHMLPSPSKGRNAVRAGQKVVLGAEADGGGGTSRQYEIVPPHGRGMVVVLQSRRPLFDRERPEVENVRDYLPVLKTRLERALGPGTAGDVLAASTFITTRP
ncbi:MAG: protein kinase [Gammaproteobacteria bacterium]|jgi:serine/threonine protein kinase|nr:protein kinase [Gammaproteobacteria bacterium]